MMEKLISKLREYFLHKFYGTIEIHFKNGHIVCFKETKNEDVKQFED
jgi:hypothetical protein